MNRTTTQVLQDHLSKRLNGDTEADIETNYAADVLILSSFGTFSGHNGVRESASLLYQSMGKAVFHYKHVAIENNYGFLEWTGESENTVVNDGADSFVVQGGKIVLQTIHYSPIEKHRQPQKKQ